MGIVVYGSYQAVLFSLRIARAPTSLMIGAQYRMRPADDQRNVQNRALRHEGAEDGTHGIFVKFDRISPVNTGGREYAPNQDRRVILSDSRIASGSSPQPPGPAALEFVEKEFSLHLLGDSLKRLLKTPDPAT